MTRSHGRLVLFAGVALAGLVSVALRAVWIQSFAREWYLQQSDWRHVATRTVTGPRGDIVDRNGNVLASSVRMSTVAFDPRHFFTHYRDIETHERVAGILAELPLFDREQFDRWAADPNPNDLPRYRVMARGMWTPDANELIARVGALGVRSLVEQAEFARIYPSPMSGGHMLGFMGIPDDAVEPRGIAGIERSFDGHLAGHALRYDVVRDPRGGSYSFLDEPAVAEARGATVQLTIDLPLQQRIEESARAIVEQYDAESAIVIVQEVATGAIRAMVAWPPIDPNIGAVDPNVRYTHPAIGVVVEPGSTSKMMTFAAALNEGLVSLDEPIDCSGGRALISGVLVSDTHRAGVVTAREVMQHSSNIGSARIGLRLSADQMRSYLLAFGLGRPTGIELPGEESGVVRMQRWPESTRVTASYGYGFSLTPLQLNAVTATIANGGEWLQPRLVERVTEASGRVVYEGTESGRRRVVSEAAAAAVTESLETVTVDDGTGRRAAVPGFRVAGKTGTARLIGANGYEEEYLASFTGFLPAEAPLYAITALVLRPDPEIGYFGGLVAAPLFREAATAALERAGIFAPSDAPASLAELAGALSVANVQVADVAPTLPDAQHGMMQLVTTTAAGIAVPDLRGMRLHEAVLAASQAGFAVTVEGSVGAVIAQEPLGTAFPGSTVHLTIDVPGASNRSVPEPVHGDDAP